jgi:biotin carboxylase
MARLRLALDRLQIAGPPTTRPLLRRLLDEPELVDNTVTTRWLENELAWKTKQ